MDIVIMLVLFLGGAAAVIHGVALVSSPAAWVVFGTLCLATAVWPLVRRS